MYKIVYLPHSLLVLVALQAERKPAALRSAGIVAVLAEVALNATTNGCVSCVLLLQGISVIHLHIGHPWKAGL